MFAGINVCGNQGHVSRALQPRRTADAPGIRYDTITLLHQRIRDSRADTAGAPVMIAVFRALERRSFYLTCYGLKSES
jgi:hypothetical protein